MGPRMEQRTPLKLQHGLSTLPGTQRPQPGRFCADPLCFGSLVGGYLLASLPMLDILRAGRLLRLIRLVRIFRALQLSDQFYHQIFMNKTKGTLVSISLVAV